MLNSDYDIFLKTSSTIFWNYPVFIRYHTEFELKSTLFILDSKFLVVKSKTQHYAVQLIKKFYLNKILSCYFFYCFPKKYWGAESKVSLPAWSSDPKYLSSRKYLFLFLTAHTNTAKN